MGLKQLANTWDSFGQEDPLWAVLSNSDKRGNRWDVDEFFETGRVEIAEVLDHLREAHGESATGRALDFGCAVGRLSQALVDHFDEVHGVDIAASMIERAGGFNRHGDRCVYHLNEQPDLKLFEDEFFDFIYSNVTLQHMEPYLAHGYIREFCRVLKPGGMLVFDLPTGMRADSRHRYFGYRLLRFGYLLWHRHLLRRPIMDMFGTERGEVTTLVEAAGCQVLHGEETDAGGPDWVGCRYCVMRPEE